MRDISVFPFSACWFLEVPTVSPGPLLSHSFSHWNGISRPQLQWNITPITSKVFSHWNRISPPQLQWNITPITPNIFSYWNGTSPQCKHTQYFQPLEWNITVIPTALATGMEHHHSYTLSASSHWNGTSQFHTLEWSINYHHSYSYTQWQLLSATGMEHHHQSCTQCFQPLEWNIITVTSKAFSHWNGTYSYIQSFQPLEWNITTTVIPNAFTHWNGTSHPVTPNAFTYWNRISPPQIHPQQNITTGYTQCFQLLTNKGVGGACLVLKAVCKLGHL